MKITCAGCDRTLNVPDTAVGKAVKCPVCGTTVKVEETYSIMPDAPPSYEAQAPGPPGGPDGLPRAGVCPGCGFLLLPGVDHCNRCGTDLETGQRREDLVGYSASFKTKLFSKTGWIATILVTGAIVAVAAVVYLRVRGWGQVYVDAEKEAEATKRREEEASRPRPEPAARSGEAKPAAKPLKRAAPQLPDPGAAFDNAFTSLVNPSASAQERGAALIAGMGEKAVPLVEKKLAETTDDANARKMLARALAKLRQSEASGLLIKLVADADEDVREEALKSLGVHGPAAQDALTAGLVSDDPAVRAAAALAARRLPFPEHTGIILSLLADTDPSVRMEAARALSARPDTPETHAALVEATGDAVLDVAAAASETLIKQRGALQDVLRALAGMGTSSQSLQSPRTVFLAMPLLTWRDPGGMDTLSTHLGGGKSGAEVFDYVRRFLDPKNPVSRVDALNEARYKGLEEPQMALAAGLCLADANDFVAKSALRFVSSLDKLDHPIPLVIMLGHEDIRFAVDVARELARRPGQATTDALKLAADGVALQRKVMATGLLARRGDEYGSEFLREVAIDRPGLPPPLAGWAAYHYSFLGNADDVPVFAEKAKSSRSDLDRAYYEAAAAKLGDAGTLANLRDQLGPTSKGFHARLVVNLLGELKDADAKGKLVYQLHQNDPELLEAVIESLSLLGDSSVVRSVIERIPQVRPETAAVLRDAVRSFGTDAEPHLLDLVDDENPRVRGAAMDCLVGLGTEASKAVVIKFVEALQNPSAGKDLRERAPEVLAAVTGKPGKQDWTSHDWARACNVRLKDISETMEFKPLTRKWLLMQVPADWKAYAYKVSHSKAPGKPEIESKLLFDPASTPRSNYRYKDERDFREKRKVRLSLAREGGKAAVAPGITVVDHGTFYAGKAKVVGMRLTDENQGRTSYYLFLFAKAGKARYYAEVCFSADTQHYEIYKTLFEKKIPGSMKIVAEE